MQQIRQRRQPDRRRHSAARQRPMAMRNRGAGANPQGVCKHVHGDNAALYPGAAP
jgi:hypothetical protein